jgi:plastocyanin
MPGRVAGHGLIQEVCMKFRYRLAASALAVAAGWTASATAFAADLPTFKLEMNDGKLNPARIEVPAGQRIKIEVHNVGKGAAEFESVELRKEKVLAPGADSFVVIAPLDKGEYKFFDDFHQSAQGVIVAK